MKKNKSKKSRIMIGIIILITILLNVICVPSNDDVVFGEPNNFKTISVSHYKAKANATSEEPKVVWYDYMTAVDDISGATEEEFNELIEYICDYRGIDYDECPFYGKGDILVQIESDYQISAIACLAIWTWESGFGTSSIAINRNNYGGISGSRGYRYFDTINEGMLYQAELLRNSYVDNGYTSWDSIGKRYCPVNDMWATHTCGTLDTYATKLYSIMH